MAFSPAAERTLRVALGDNPLRSEHERLLRTALRRGEPPPEPPADAKLDGTYSTEALAIARDTWLRRMVHEHHSAAVFSRLLPQLMAAGATLEFKTSTLRMSMDELRHAALCGAVVELLGGTAEVETRLETAELPAHDDCSPVEAALRNVMFVGCMSETVALALLTEERELTTEPLIRRVVEQLSADEVLHAKLGWVFLATVWPTLDSERRARTNAYLPVAFGYLERKMHDAMPVAGTLPDPLLAEMHALGVLESQQGRELFAETVREVIVPRLADYGLDARAGWESRVRPGL
jgi:hypothetical protein